MQLPQVLREDIILMCLPETMWWVHEPKVVEFSNRWYEEDVGDPEFVCDLASLGNEELRLECIVLALQNVVLRV